MPSLADRLSHALASKQARDPSASQAELARYCGAKAPSVSDWFRGETVTLKASSLVLAAEYLGVRARWLLDGKLPMHDGGHVEPKPSSLATCLDALAAALAAAPASSREALALNLAGWARDGGRGPWQQVVQALLDGASGKQRRAA